jgi:hypothetical protein
MTQATTGQELTQEQLEEVLAAITPEQATQEFLGLAEKAQKLKVDYASLQQTLRKAQSADEKTKAQQEINRYLQRTPVVEIPNLLNELAVAIAGAVQVLGFQIRSGGYEDEEEDGGAQGTPEEFREAVAILSARVDLVSFVTQRIDEASEVVKSLVDGMNEDNTEELEYLLQATEENKEFHAIAEELGLFDLVKKVHREEPPAADDEDMGIPIPEATTEPTDAK